MSRMPTIDLSARDVANIPIGQDCCIAPAPDCNLWRVLNNAGHYVLCAKTERGLDWAIIRKSRSVGARPAVPASRAQAKQARSP